MFLFNLTQNRLVYVVLVSMFQTSSHHVYEHKQVVLENTTDTMATTSGDNIGFLCKVPINLTKDQNPPWVTFVWNLSNHAIAVVSTRNGTLYTMHRAKPSHVIVLGRLNATAFTTWISLNNISCQENNKRLTCRVIVPVFRKRGIAFEEVNRSRLLAISEKARGLFFILPPCPKLYKSNESDCNFCKTTWIYQTTHVATRIAKKQSTIVSENRILQASLKMDQIYNITCYHQIGKEYTQLFHTRETSVRDVLGNQSFPRTSCNPVVSFTTYLNYIPPMKALESWTQRLKCIGRIHGAEGEVVVEDSGVLSLCIVASEDVLKDPLEVEKDRERKVLLMNVGLTGLGCLISAVIAVGFVCKIRNQLRTSDEQLLKQGVLHCAPNFKKKDYQR